MKLALHGEREPSVPEFLELADTLLDVASEAFKRPCFLGAQLVLGVTQRRDHQARLFTLDLSSINKSLLDQPDSLLALNVYPRAQGREKHREVDGCLLPFNNRVGYVAHLGPDLQTGTEQGRIIVHTMLGNSRNEKLLVHLQQVEHVWERQGHIAPVHALACHM